MVKYTDVEFTAFWKKKSFKKKAPKEAEAVPKVEVVPREEAILTVSIFNVAAARVEVMGELVEVRVMAEAPETAKAPTGGESPLWAVEATQPATEGSVPEAVREDKPQVDEGGVRHKSRGKKHSRESSRAEHFHKRKKRLVSGPMR